MARLRICQDGKHWTHLELQIGRRVHMGRAAENELVLDDLRSSRVHAVISHEGGKWLVKDLDSRNGTRLNGRAIRDAVLQPGDRIEIGQALIELEDAAAPVARSGRRRQAGAEFQESDFAAPRSEAPGKGGKGQLLLGAASVLVVLAGIMLVQGSNPEQAPEPPLALPSHEAVGAIPKGDMSRPHSAVFAYVPPDEMPTALRLVYKAYDIDTADEVRVYLNGEPIQALQPTGDGLWSSERELELPMHVLKRGEKNYLVFQHTHNKPGEPPAYAWGVSNVDIVPVVELPCDPAAAEESFRIGSKLHDDRRVLASNLFHAIERLQLARAHSRSCLPKPIFYTEVTSTLQAARQELEAAYRFYQVELTKARKLGRIEECLRYLSLIEQLVPDENDPRHIQAKRWRRSLPAAGAKPKNDSPF
jgi:hypothetical protein